MRQVLDFYSLFFPIAEGYSERAKSTVELLQNAEVTEFRVVTTPAKCVRDASFFIDQLSTRSISPEKICVNRAWMHPVPGTARAGLESDLLAWYRSVSQSHREAIEQLKESVGSKVASILVFNELERDVDGLEALEQIAAQDPVRQRLVRILTRFRRPGGAGRQRGRLVRGGTNLRLHAAGVGRPDAPVSFSPADRSQNAERW